MSAQQQYQRDRNLVTSCSLLSSFLLTLSSILLFIFLLGLRCYVTSSTRLLNKKWWVVSGWCVVDGAYCS